MKKYKYKYYFKKPKSEISKDIFKGLALGMVFVIAATSPYFCVNLIKAFKMKKKHSRKRVYDTFSYLRRRGYINTDYRGRNVRVSLTPEGKKIVGAMQIDDLKIKKPKKWDGKWRVVSFDISEQKRVRRDIIRRKMEELGFVRLHKSVWAHAFDCRAEIEMIRDFFGISEKDMCLIVANSIEGDIWLLEKFGL